MIISMHFFIRTICTLIFMMNFYRSTIVFKNKSISSFCRLI